MERIISALEEDPPRFLEAKMVSTRWEAYAATIAAEVDETTWEAVTTAYHGVWNADDGFDGTEHGTTESGLRLARRLRAEITSGRDTLDNAASVND
jgi:hypothetical protein